MADLIADPFRAARLILHLRRQGIRDDGVLSAIETINRGVFVDKSLKPIAGEDAALPIPCGQVLPKPVVVAQLLSALSVSPGRQDTVLLVGAGSGYVAALLAQIGRYVWAVERYRRLVDEATKRLQDLKVDNVKIKHGDGLNGWREHGPFDRILLMGAVSEIPDALIEQLGRGGILVAPYAAEGRPQGIRALSKSGVKHDLPIAEPVTSLKAGLAKAL